MRIISDRPTRRAFCRHRRTTSHEVVTTLLTVCSLFITLSMVVGCSSGQENVDYVARLGDKFYTRSELNSALATIPAARDSSEARAQILRQWTTTELLYNEAISRGLKNDPDVASLIHENERSVLASALLSRIYEEEYTAPNETEILGYYEQHKDQLVLREPFVKVWYLSAAERDSAEAARSEMKQLDQEAESPDVWQKIVDRFADDPEGSLLLSDSFYPESRLLSFVPTVQAAVRNLSSGDTLPVVEDDSRFIVVRLRDRLPAGSLPDLSLIRDQIVETLTIENRKQLYARQVQRLRNEAIAREELEFR